MKKCPPSLIQTEQAATELLANAPSADGVWTQLRLLPGALPEGSSVEGDAALVVEHGTIRWLGPEADLPDDCAHLPRHCAGGTWVGPGLVDCHTHLVYGGQRAHEFAMRLAGASYEDVARAGGGIVSSVRATREADEDTLFALAAPRLQALLAEGVCAIEIKSGYGLALAHERKQLRVARRLGEAFGVTVRTTFLGAHALPPEYAGRSQAYIDLVCHEMLPALTAEGLVDAVDVFCERIGFSLAETEQVFQAAQALGLPVKLHAEQLSDMGGAALAARRVKRDVHSIWALVEHVASWNEIVAERLSGGSPTVTLELNFPPVTRTTPAAWKATLRRLARSQGRFRRAVARFPIAKLGRRRPKVDHTWSVLIHGQIQHQLYHAGQIAMLRRVLGRPVRAS